MKLKLIARLEVEQCPSPISLVVVRGWAKDRLARKKRNISCISKLNAWPMVVMQAREMEMEIGA